MATKTPSATAAALDDARAELAKADEGNIIDRIEALKKCIRSILAALGERS